MLFRINREHLHTEILMQSGALEAADWQGLLRSRTNHFLIADSYVAALHGESVKECLRHTGRDIEWIPVAPGEPAKSLEEYLRVAKAVSTRGVDRNSMVISFGGASTANLAGFIAATLMRGIGLIHIPTTLLAQLDGTIDFKQAINLDGVKNLIGSYYAPRLVIVDPRFLATLPEQHLANGLAEGLKHALVQDESLFRLFVNNATERSPAFLQESIERTVALKVLILQSKAYENDEMLLQYGHAVGHALESVTQNELLHGEAIAIGMCVSAEAAHTLGFCDLATVQAHYDLMHAYGLPNQIPDRCSVEDVLRLLYRDKYRSDGRQHMSMIRKIGEPVEVGGQFGIAVEEETLRRACFRNATRVTQQQMASCA